MQVDIETTGPTERKLNITVPSTMVDEELARAYREVSKTARIPGFRPGKAPRSLLEMHYGSQVRSEVENKLINRTLFLALQQKDVSPVGMPNIETGDLEKGSDFSYTAEVEVQPEIEIGQYKHLVAPTPTVEIDEEEIDQELSRMREQAAQLVPVLVRDVVEDGDVAVVDFEGTIGGVPFEGGKGENAHVEIGGTDYIPGFAEGLLGAKVPSERDVPVTFPEEYGAKNLAGKQASFHIAIKEIKRRELPELDDEFAKDLGEESLEALRSKLTDATRSQKERDATEERRKTLLKALVEANPFDLPRSMITSQAERMVAGVTERFAAMTGQQISLSDDERASLAKESEADAEFQVRSGLLLLEVAKKEGLQVDAATIDAEIEAMAEQAGNDATRLKAHYANPEHRQSLEFRMLEEMTLGFLIEHAAQSEEDAAAAKQRDDSEPEPQSDAQDKEADAQDKEPEPQSDAQDKKSEPQSDADEGDTQGKKTAAKKTPAKKKTAAKKKAPAKKKTAAKKKTSKTGSAKKKAGE
jgi:trigger factor